MQIPVQIIFRDIPPSEAVEARIREKADKLQHFYPHIKRCRVIIEEQHRHHQGNLYNIKIDISVPEKEIVVNQMKHGNHAHEDIYVAVRDAFDAAKRQLEDYARIRRGNTKSHNTTSRGSREKRNIDKLEN